MSFNQLIAPFGTAYTIGANYYKSDRPVAMRRPHGPIPFLPVDLVSDGHFLSPYLDVSFRYATDRQFCKSVYAG